MFHLTPFDVRAEWGRLKLARPTKPGSDGWGVLSSLKGTPWARAISAVSHAELTHALNGYSHPLEKRLGISPEDFHKTQEGLLLCSEREVCPLFESSKCFPKRGVPSCYTPPSGGEAARDVALAIQEGRYVVVVVGGKGCL